MKPNRSEVEAKLEPRWPQDGPREASACEQQKAAHVTAPFSGPLTSAKLTGTFTCRATHFTLLRAMGPAAAFAEFTHMDSEECLGDSAWARWRSN